MAAYVNDRRAIHEGRVQAIIPSPPNPIYLKGGGVAPVLNVAHGPGLKNGTATLKIDGNPVSVAGSRFESHPATPDKIVGVAGVRSGVVGGAAEPITYSGDTKFESRASVRSFDRTKSNSMVIDPGWAAKLAIKMLPEPYGKLAQKVLEKLPDAFMSQLAALGDSLTDPAMLVGPALKLVGKLIPGVNAVVGGAAAAQAASEVAALASEVQQLLTPPLTDAKLDQIAQIIADGVAAITIGFVLGKAAKLAKKAVDKVATRHDNRVNPNTQGPIQDDVNKGHVPGTVCELGTCHPVIFATGVKIMSETDFKLPGLIPLQWQRFYRSSDRRPGWLGWGWSVPLAVELALVFGAIHYYDAKGRRVELPALERGQSHFNAREKFTLTHHEDGSYTLEATDGLRQQFAAPQPGQWRLPLCRLADRNGNAITVHYPPYAETSVQGLPPRPLGLTDSAGRRLHFVWNDQGLLLEVRLAPGVAAGQRHEGGVLVRYAYDTEGNLSGDSQPNLAAATDALGGSWRYRYQNHLMVAYTTKTGFTHHQEWSRLDAGGRVIRTWCDEPGVLDTRFTYDVAHRVTHVTDALGRVSSYHYNPHHEVIAIEEPGPADASGAPTRILTRTEMDASGNPTEAVDALGRTTRYQWDERGNLLAVTDAAGATTRFAYNALNLPVEITDAEGGHWRNTYDERGNLLAHTDALGHTTGYQVDARGLPLVITDALGKPKQLQWDGAGQLVAYTDCSGQTTRYGYDALGNLLQSVDALGQVSVYQHDALGQLRQLTQPDGAQHRYGYDAAGNLTHYTDPLGAATRYQYNGLDQPVARIDALGHSLRYAYDVAARLVVLQNENGAHYQFAYDAADNLTQEIGFDGRIQRYRYNPAGELTELHERQQEAAGEHTPYGPHPSDPLPKRTLFTRDALGRLTAKRHVLASADGRLADTEAPSHYTYDRLGRMRQALNGAARVGFAYDALSQLTEEVQQHLPHPQAAPGQGQPPQPLIWRHGYDALGQRSHSTLPSGKQLQWLSYGSGHVHQITVDGHVISDIERDALHRETSRTQGALQSQYGFDPMGRLAAHKVRRLQAQAEQRAQSLWDQGRRPSAALPALPGGQRIARQFAYDLAGNLRQTQDSLRGLSQYRYDPLGRILGAVKGQPAQPGSSVARTETFAFDPAGNILNPNRGQMGPGTEAGTQEGSHAISSGGVSQASTPSNRIAVYEDLRFAYDVHGNITERRIGWHTVQKLSYSAEHQLKSITVTRLHDKPPLKVVGQAPQELAATTQTTHYRYDALGRRIDKSGEFGATRFGWDGDLLSLEIRGSKQSEYLYEPDSFVPLAKLESAAHVQRPEHKAINPKKVASLFKATPSDSEQNEAPAHASQAQAAIETEVEATTAKAKDFAVFYYQCDQIGAPQELTDEQGNIVWAAEYKVWGRTTSLEVSATGTDNLDPYDLNRFWPGGPRDLKARSSSTTQALNHVEQNLRFQGQYHDHESGLHYNRFRYYDPQIGRFVSQDPIGIEAGWHHTAYAPNPFTWIDPLGLVKFTPKTKKAILKENEDFHGAHTCEKCGCALKKPEKSQKGVTPPKDEWQIDHIEAESKGGAATEINGQALCRKCNRDASDKDKPNYKEENRKKGKGNCFG